MPASQTRSVSYRIGEAASGGMGAISQPANQAGSGPGQNEKVSQRAFLDCCTQESGRSFERGERQLRAKTGREQMQQKKLIDHPVGADQEGLGDGQPERLRGSKVDDEIELTGLFDWKIRRLRAAHRRTR